MFQGRLLAIAICDAAALPLRLAPTITAVAGQGLAGDRYFAGKGIGQKAPAKPEQEVTLVEAEAIAAANADYKLSLTHLDTRRNLLTEGVPLNHLVGKTFRVGPALLRGIELCEPCGHLEKLTCQGVKRALLHRGGLRAQILQGGELQPGDVISLAEEVMSPAPSSPS